MANVGSFLLLHPTNCLPADVIPSLLGRICDNPNQPSRNYFPENPQLFYSGTAQPLRIEATTPAIFVDSASDTLARTLLQGLFTAERQRADSTSTDWHGERVRIFTLPQEKQMLGQILDVADHKLTAEKWLREQESLYMITGFVTMINATVKNGSSGARSVETEASISKALDVAISGLGGVPIQLPDLAAQWKSSRQANSSLEATYVTETVIAIRYQQLARKWRLISWLKKGEIRLCSRTDIRGGRMFGVGDKEVDQDMKEWQEYEDVTLTDGEAQEIVFSPSVALDCEGELGNVLIQLKTPEL